MHGADGRGHWWRPPVHHTHDTSIPRPNEAARSDQTPVHGAQRRDVSAQEAEAGMRMPGRSLDHPGRGPSLPSPAPGSRTTDCPWLRGEYTVYSYPSCMQTRTGTDTAHTDPVAVYTYSYVLFFLPDPFLGIVNWGGGCSHRKWTREGTFQDSAEGGWPTGPCLDCKKIQTDK
jgi:hypothetical protein